MQWFKSAMVISSAVLVAAMANGCSGGGGKADGGTDSGVHPIDSGKDVAQSDTGPNTGCPSTDPACEVCDVSSYSPTAQGKPVGPKSNMCPSADITAFVDACLGSKAAPDGSTCQTWQKSEQTSNANCLNCAFTLDTAASWGVLVCNQSSGCKVNIPGCLDLALNQVSQENSTSTGSCGDLLSASYGCQDAACSTCTAGSADQTSCFNNAVGAECKSYADAVNTGTPCAVLNSDNPPAAVNTCFPSNPNSGFTDAEWATFVNEFCGQ